MAKLPPEAVALLNAIAGPESGGSYDVIYGGQKMSGYEDHPRVSVPITSGPNKGKTSSAAGKYQFLKGTWDEYREKLGLKDFSPESQDKAAWALAQDSYRNATGKDLTEALRSGDPETIASVGKALSPIWTSLPGGIEQGTNTSKFVNAYNSADTSSAVEAVNTLGGAGSLADVPANPVQTVAYVAPPFSGGQSAFTPLLGGQQQTGSAPVQQQEVTPEPSVGQTEPVQEDILKSFLPAGTDLSGAETGAPAKNDGPDDILKLFVPDDAPAAAVAAADEKSPVSSAIGLNDAVRSVATGVPIIGGLLNKANAATNALIAPAINPMLDEGNQLKGDTYSERYANSLAEQEGMDASYAAQHPIANTVGNVIGNVGGTIPMIAAAPAAFGANASATTGRNILTGLVGSGIIGTADSGIRSGGDLNSMMGGGALAAVGGASGPLIGKAAGYIGNKLVDAYKSLTPKGAAANNLMAAVIDSGATPAAVSNELVANARLAPMDANPALQQMAQDLATQTGPARSVLARAAESRASGAKGTVNSAYDTAAGSVPDVKAYLDGLKATTKKNAKTAFDGALNGAKPVDVTPVLADIDSAVGAGTIIPQGPVEQALARVRAKMANGTETLTDPQRLHEVQSQLRIEADTLAKGSSGQDKLVANALRKVRGKLIDQIDVATGGKFKPAQQQYADDNAIQDAFDKGLEVFKGGTGKNSLENRPEYWQDWVKNATPAELDAAKVGTRVAVDQTIGSVRNAAAKGEALADVDINVGRLEALLGKSETGKLVQTLKDEQKIAATNAKLFAGSQTAARQATNKLTNVTNVSSGFHLGPMSMGGVGGALGLSSGNNLLAIGSALGGVALSGGKYLAQKGMNARDLARNRLMAEALSGDVAGFNAALAPAGAGARIGSGIKRGTNRLISTASPSVSSEINQRLTGKVPPARRTPLEITVRPKRPVPG